MNKFKRILSFMFIFIFVLAPFSHAANDVLLAENTGITH